ncbi:MAG: hypothetical protein IIB03_01760, partial [Acidobacteria bacterium]|nr:hypothetical protein [Acidobacteriota bacterium]
MRGNTRSCVGSLCLLFGFVILSTANGLGDQMVLEPAKDNTIWEDQSGSLSNGSGVAFFAGVVLLGLLPLAAAGLVEMRRSVEWFIALRYLVAK